MKKINMFSHWLFQGRQTEKLTRENTAEVKDFQFRRYCKPKNEKKIYIWKYTIISSSLIILSQSVYCLSWNKYHTQWQIQPRCCREPHPLLPPWYVLGDTKSKTRKPKQSQVREGFCLRKHLWILKEGQLWRKDSPSCHRGVIPHQPLMISHWLG